jgi:hypothetical protein
LGRADLISNFGNTDLANLVEEPDDISVHRHRFGTNRNLDVGVRLMLLKK